MSPPRPIAQPPGEFAHMVEDCVNIGHDVMAVDPHDRSLGRPQRHMKGGTPFSDIDLFPAKHRVDSRPQARFFGQLQEELDGFIRYAVLRIIQEDAHGFYREALAAPGVIGEKRSQMDPTNGLVVRLESLPRLPFRRCLHAQVLLWLSH